MVRTSLWQKILLLLGLIALTPKLYAAGLTLTLEHEQVELGHPIWLTIRSEQTAVSLSTLDFSAWQGKVVLPRSYDLNLGEDNRSQTLRLRLYPLHTGRLSLPGLRFMQQRTSALEVNVVAARDEKTHTPIDFQYQVSTLTPWQQQQVIVACSITVNDSHAVFNQASDAVNVNTSEVHLLPMQVQRAAIRQDGKARTRYQLGWVVQALRAGKLHVQLPPLQYVRDGVVTRQFYVAPFELNVQAMPAWLPGTIPVGQVRVTQYTLAQRWLTSSVLSHLQLQLQLDGVAADLIPAYALQLHSDRHLQYYAAQQTLRTRVDHTGIHQQLAYDIPLVAKHIGIVHLPDLRLQYFDPHSGTLKTATVHGAALIVLNRGLQGVLLLVLVALLFWLLRTLWRVWLRSWQRYQTYQLALRQLLTTNSLAAIRQVMQTMAQAEGWTRNFTFVQWQGHMQRLTPTAQALAVTGLNAARYGRGEIDLAEVVQVLTRICRQRRFAFAHASVQG
jgi:hypothetical protein